MKIFQNIHQEILTICHAISNAGGTALLVGGCVRDELMGFIHGMDKPKTKDIDIEVFGLSQEQLTAVLKTFGRVDLVGESFAVTKLTTSVNDYDFNLPRRERKTGAGHTSFEIEVDPDMSIRDAAERRDLTINAASYNPLTQEIFDPYNGVSDIKKCVLKHVSPRFAEDPLRVLRVMQFSGRFRFHVSLETVSLCVDLLDEFSTLPKERIGIEFVKLLTKGINMKNPLDFLYCCGWYEKFAGLEQVYQDGNFGAMVNMLDSLTVGHNYFKRPTEERLVLSLAAFCWFMEDVTPFLKQIDCTNSVLAKVYNLLQVGHEVVQAFEAEDQYIAYKKAVVKLKVSRDMLAVLLSNLPDYAFGCKSVALDLHINVTDKMLKPRVKAKDLMELGWTQGRELGDELKRLHTLQLETNNSREELLATVRLIKYIKKI